MDLSFKPTKAGCRFSTGGEGLFSLCKNKTCRFFSFIEKKLITHQICLYLTVYHICVCVCVQVLMLRRCLTWLRATWVVRVLPLDQNILLHQIVGYAILCYTLLHTTAHVFNFGTHAAQITAQSHHEDWRGFVSQLQAKGVLSQSERKIFDTRDFLHNLQDSLRLVLNHQVRF